MEPANITAHNMIKYLHKAQEADFLDRELDDGWLANSWREFIGRCPAPMKFTKRTTWFDVLHEMVFRSLCFSDPSAFPVPRECLCTYSL